MNYKRPQRNLCTIGRVENTFIYVCTAAFVIIFIAIQLLTARADKEQ